MTLRELDHRLTCALHNQAGKYSWLDRLAVFCARDLPVVFVGLPVLIKILVPFSSPEASWLFIAEFFIVITFSQIGALLLQKFIGRKRPFQREHLHPIYQARFPSPSFPSGHATLVAVVLWISHILVFLPALSFAGVPLPVVFWVLCIMGGIILLARVYGGLHYVSDILAGLLVGSAMIFIIGILLAVGMRFLFQVN